MKISERAYEIAAYGKEKSGIDVDLNKLAAVIQAGLDEMRRFLPEKGRS